MQDSLTSSNLPEAGKLLLVDGHCYAYRAFYGISALTGPAGKPTNAIYGFIRMLGKARERVCPTHVAVVWDGGLAEERMSLLPEYKAQRAKMPADLAGQLDGMVEYLRAAGYYSLLREGCEADDYIATLAVRAAGLGYSVVIASSDKDFMQLVAGEVKLLVPHDKTEGLWDAEQVRRKTGVGPGQIVDWLSLVGDASDNIPGVEGIGLKTAADLLGRFGSIEVLYKSLAEVRSERVRGALRLAEETVRRNRKLIQLNDTMPHELRMEELALGESDTEQLRRLYSGWGFRGLLQALQPASREAEEDLFQHHAQASA
jgi:DNA polymerase-1